MLGVFLCVLKIGRIDDTSSDIYGAHKRAYDDVFDDVFYDVFDDVFDDILMMFLMMTMTKS